MSLSVKKRRLFGDTQQLLLKEDLYFEQFPLPLQNHRWPIRNYKLKTQVGQLPQLRTLRCAVLNYF